jgi:hypothetical protein
MAATACSPCTWPPGRSLSRSAWRRCCPRERRTIGAACVLLTRVSINGNYLDDLFVGFLLFGPGLGAAFVASQIAALTGVAERESGLAAGLVDSAFHVGAALGIAVVTTVAVARTEEVLGDGSAQLNAITEGFQAAFMVAVVFAIVGALAALAFLRRRASAQTAPPSVAAVPEQGAELN